MKRIAWALAALALAAPAAAQEKSEAERERDRFLAPTAQIGSRFVRAPETASESDARERQKRLAKCVFYARKDKVRELLANSDFDRIDFDATSFTGENLFDQLNFSSCLGQAMKNSQYKMYVTMPFSTLRNLLAEEAYLYDTEEAPVLAAGAPTLIKDRFALTRGGPRAAVMAEVADCITYRDAAGAHAFPEERPGTKGEREALEALGPKLITCLEADEPPKLSTSMVRQMIADGMWARLHHGVFAAGAVSEGGAGK